MRHLLTAIGIVGILGLAPAGSIPPPLAGEAPLKLPADLKLADLTGKATRLDFAAAPVTLVNFWATWCMPCREEMPEIVKLFAKHREKGFRAVGVAMESGEAAEIRSFLEENRALGINYPIFVGDDATADTFGGIDIVPTTFLVNRKGEVVKRYYGVSRGFGARVGADIKDALAADH